MHDSAGKHRILIVDHCRHCSTMLSHLTKPIDVEALLGILEQPRPQSGQPPDW